MVIYIGLIELGGAKLPAFMTANGVYVDCGGKLEKVYVTSAELNEMLAR